LNIVAVFGLVTFVCALIVDWLYSRNEINRLKAELHQCYGSWNNDLRQKDDLHCELIETKKKLDQAETTGIYDWSAIGELNAHQAGTRAQHRR
jgi:hypothetical protein